MSLWECRKDFPILERYTFLDNANVCPSPVQVADAVHRTMTEKVEFGPLAWKRWMDVVERARANVSKLVGCSAEEVWFINSTADGLNMASRFVEWRPGDNVVVTDREYPSNVYPWLRLAKHGVEARIAKCVYAEDGTATIPLSAFEELVDDRTRVVSVSTIDFLHGLRSELKAISRIAHEKGALFIVDGIQSVGAFQEDVKRDEIDFLAFGGQKWTLAPSAGGAFYIKRELCDSIDPSSVGWFSVSDIFGQFDNDWTKGYSLAKGARRFATGHLNYLSISGLEASTGYLLGLGLPRIEGAVTKLCQYVMERAEALGFVVRTPRSPLNRGPIVHFLVDSYLSCWEKLKAQGIMVSARAGGLRVSPNFYNSFEEIDRLMGALQAR